MDGTYLLDDLIVIYATVLRHSRESHNDVHASLLEGLQSVLQCIAYAYHFAVHLF